MRTNIRRVLIVGAVVVWSLWAIYPPDDTIKLGLDLNGGAHLVLRVKTDDALTAGDAEHRRAAARRADEAPDRLHHARSLGLDRVPRRGHHGRRGVSRSVRRARRRPSSARRATAHTRFASSRRPPSEIRRETVQQALHTIERRVNELGVPRPSSRATREADQILVELPGVRGRRSREADHQIDGAAAADAGRAGAISRPRRRAAGLWQRTASGPGGAAWAVLRRDAAAARLLRRPQGAGRVRRLTCAMRGSRSTSSIVPRWPSR